MPKIRTGVILKRLAVSAVVVPVFSAQAAIVVQMQVNASETGLDITTQGTCQNGTNSNGCVKAQGRQPINFNLVGNRSCSAGGSWELDSVALGMARKSTGNLTAVAASDFNADQSSGEVTANNQSGNSIQIRNNNTAVYDAWYTVYATCGDSEIETDPRIENDGSGRQ